MSRWHKKTPSDSAMNAGSDRSREGDNSSVSSGEPTAPSPAIGQGSGTLTVAEPVSASPSSSPGVTTKKETSLSFRVPAQNGSHKHADTVVVWRKDTDDSVYHSSVESLPHLYASSAGNETHKDAVSMVTGSKPSPATNTTPQIIKTDSVKSSSPELTTWSDSGLQHPDIDNGDQWYAASDSTADNLDSSCEQNKSLNPIAENQDNLTGELAKDSKDANKTSNSGKESGSGGTGFGSVHYSTNGEINLNTPKSQTPHGKSSEKKRKGNWYNVLSPTYKSKSEDFKRIFKDLPNDERLLVDYSCALQKDILVHGRLYVTQNWICFYANIFRWETVLTIRCKEIITMTKEKTARVIPNALQIQTEMEKYFFTSFSAREKTFLMLFRVWQNALMEQPMGAQELWKWVHYYYGDELGLNSSDEDYVAPSAEELKKIRENETGQAEEEGTKDKADLSDGVANGDAVHNLSAPCSMQGLDSLARSSPECSDPRPVINKVSSANQLQLPSPGVTGTDVLTDQGDTTEDSEGEVMPFDPPQGPINGETFLDEEYDIPVDQLYDWCFTDSKSYRLFHHNRNTTDLQMTPWSDEPDRSRVLTYILQLNQSWGPKTSPCTEKQLCYRQSIPGKIYIVDTDCVTSGVPYGESFYVVNRYWLTRKSRHRSRLQIVSQVRYKKSVWGPIKSLIEKNVSSGLRESYGVYGNHLKRECEKFAEIVAGPDVVAGQPIKKKVLRRRRAHSHSLTGDRLPSSKRSTDTPQSSTQGTPVKSLHRTSVDLGVQGYGTDLLARIVCALLLLLVVFNALLFYKLASLEAKANLHMTQQKTPFANMECPSSQAQWQDLLKQQQQLHQSEVARWRDILTTSVTLMDEMKHTLMELKESIDKRMSDVASEKT